ncbi:C39 family peptidase [Vagococcus hydrophili]|uniref:Family C39 peptidase n=1 Tax=Vagococcus hydrophili TaxID=2714947 RepID=A0A6G8AWF3_9ENTE|nr:C39 family peptidase [Vagococcus hydrophili]QIL49310.1 family C39 peptidase [Vagococcus hydrophili]
MKKIINISVILIISVASLFGTKVIFTMAVENNRIAKEKCHIRYTKHPNLLKGMNTVTTQENQLSEYHLPVPLFDQMSEPSLIYGCEVTALSMILTYYSFDYNKNQLQEKIKKEPYQVSDTLLGDPDSGFVGDATGKNPGTGVNVQPVFDLAQSLVNSPYEVVNSTGSSLSELFMQIKAGRPVWVITTIDYKVPRKEDWIDWPTENGLKKYGVNHHAAVITGFDKENVFLNDPYGKEVTVSQDTFEKIYNETGKQSLYIK